MKARAGCSSVQINIGNLFGNGRRKKRSFDGDHISKMQNAFKAGSIARADFESANLPHQLNILFYRISFSIHRRQQETLREASEPSEFFVCQMAWLIPNRSMNRQNLPVLHLPSCLQKRYGRDGTNKWRRGTSGTARTRHTVHSHRDGMNQAFCTPRVSRRFRRGLCSHSMK